MGFLGFNKNIIMPGSKKPLRRKVGIAFGGGGARGFAHLGVIKALYENDIHFDHIAGVSAGSIAAAAFAVEMPYDEMKAAALKIDKKDFLTSKIFFIPSDPKKVQETFNKLLGQNRDDFKKCKTPLSILAVDIISGAEHVFTEGLISKAVSASSAIPGVFNPVPHNDMLLMDGGLMNNVPASVLRDAGCEVVVSVHVGDFSTPVAKSQSLIDVVPAAIKILVRATSHKGIEKSQVVIVPDMEKQKFGSLENIETMIEAGYAAAMARMDEIKKLFES